MISVSVTMVPSRLLSAFYGVITLLILLALQLIALQPVNADELQSNESHTTGVAGYTHQQALSLGGNIYRKGILTNGEPMTAFVQQDISVDGEIFTCELCHRESGLGTSEGYVVALPVNSQNLFRPRVLWDPRRRHSRSESKSTRSRQIPSHFIGQDLRPAYTEPTLGHAIRSGIDPSGRTLDHIMPRYDLGDRDLAVLIYYLKNLTTAYSPGVTDEKLYFATIVTEGVREEDKDAMLNVLETYINSRNAQTRNQVKRAKKGVFNKREADASYRLLELSVWELKGRPETWQRQLDQYYKNKPVFAVLGGIADGDWAPIQKFSESRNLPVIFPVTDRPTISIDNRNTIYFSKGLYQEGESTARYLKGQQGQLNLPQIIQVYKKGSDGEVVARGFSETWNSFSAADTIKNYAFNDDDPVDEKLRQELAASTTETVVLLWGDKKAISSANVFKRSVPGLVDFFVSSTLLHNDYSLISDELKDRTYITYPYSTPGEKERIVSILKTWLKIKGIPEADITIQAKMYFLGWQLSDIFAGMKSEFYRDYFLEKFEMMKDQTHTIAVYPRLSLGPDQRYASKGCYIVQLSSDSGQKFIKKSNWIIH